MRDPTYFCGDEDDTAAAQRESRTRQERAAHLRRVMDHCAHPVVWRAPVHGLMSDGMCQLCGASASTITRQQRERGET